MSFQTQKIDEILLEVQKGKNVQMENLEATALKLSQAVDNLQIANPNQVPNGGTNSPSTDQKWQSECQDIMMSLAEKLEKIEKMVETRVETNHTSEEIIVISS